MQKNNKIKKKSEKTNIFQIKSKYILKTIFSYMSKNRQYHICYRSKKLQSLVDISITTYQIVSFSNKHLSLSFIQLYETIKLRIPSSTNNEIIQCLWDKYSEEQTPIILTQINHPSISSLNTQINLNNRLNTDIQLNIINNKQFTSQMTSNQYNILKHITIFIYDFKISTNNQKAFDQFATNLNQLSQDKLTSLNISGLKLNYCSNKANLIYSIANFSSLTHLTLASNVLKDEGAIMLINSLTIKYYSTKLSHINLSDNYLTDACIDSIEKLLQFTHSSLLNFDLSSNFISSKGIKVLSIYFSQLTHLNISNNPINNEGLIHLLSEAKMYLSSILQLNISSLNINAYLLMANIDIFSQLQYTPITHLDFNCMEGISLESLINQIKEIPTLQSLKLSSFFFKSPISLNDIAHIDQLALTNCTHIDNVFNHSFNMTNLIHLDIHLCTFSINYPSLEFLRLNTQLRVLNVFNCNIHMEAFSPLWKCFGNIEELYLGHNCFTTKSVISLASSMQLFTRLRIFDISSNAMDTDEMKLILLNLKHCKMVSNLNISNIQFDYDNYIVFLKLCKELLYLNELILFDTGINDNQLKDLLLNSELIVRFKVLNLSKNPINHNGINEILRKSSLFVGLEKLYLMCLVISTQMKEDLKNCFGDIVFLK